MVRAGFLISALYNLAGVSIAAAGLLAPIVCAILMPISSATVVVFACAATTWLGARLLPSPSKRRNHIVDRTARLLPTPSTLEVACACSSCSFSPASWSD